MATSEQVLEDINVKLRDMDATLRPDRFPQTCQV